MGPTMDHQIIRALFGATSAAGQLLGVDGEFAAKLVAMRQRIAPNSVGRHGQLQEWLANRIKAKRALILLDTCESGALVAGHVRSRVAHKHSTTPEHMPSSHRRYAEWSPARMLREAGKIGPATIALFEAIMKAKPHPEQGFRSCLGILSLVKSFGPERVEAAARRGNDIGATTYGSIKSILQNGLDKAYLRAEHDAFAKPSTPDAAPIRHPNIRGRDYYH